MSEHTSSVPTTPHHRLRVRAQVGGLSLEVDAEFSAPWTILFGPSGSGKTSLLRAMCGLLPRSRFASAVEFNRCDSSGRWEALEKEGESHPPAARLLAYAPQGAFLFPHLSVGENVRFGSSLAHKRCATDDFNAQTTTKDPRGQGPLSPDLSEQACELFELQPLWNRRPAELSGGERQRVNLARAYARPYARLLLLDEPFTGFDRELRDRLLPRLWTAARARALPVISVTHDVEEAFLLDAEVLRLEAGRLLARGLAGDILRRERVELLSALGGPIAPS